MGGLSFTNGARGDQLVYQPDCISLVELWHNNGPFDLIKLDIEGMERAVLDDARQLLEVEQQVAIWAECNDSPHSLDLAELMLSFGGRSLYYASWPADNLGSLGDSGEPIFPYAREAALLAANRAVAPNDELIAAGCDMVQISSRESLRRAMWLTPRWAPRKWWTDKTTALVAQAVHDLSGESYETYLSGTAGAGGSAVLTREQLEARLEAAEALSKERLAAFADLQQELVDLQASLSDLERVAAERLAEAEINRQRAKRAERSLANIRLQAPRNQQ
jgi:hypothetical protein